MWRHSNKQQKIIDYPSREAKMWKSFFFLHFVNRMWSSRVREFFFCGTSRHREQRKNQIGKTCSQPFFKSFWTTFAIFIFNRSFFLIFQWFRRVVCWALNQWQHLRVEHLVPHPPKIVQNHFFAISNNFCGKRFFSFDKKSKWQKNYFVLVWWKKNPSKNSPNSRPSVPNWACSIHSPRIQKQKKWYRNERNANRVKQKNNKHFFVFISYLIGRNHVFRNQSTRGGGEWSKQLINLA